ETLREHIFKAAVGSPLAGGQGRLGTWTGMYRGTQYSYPKDQEFYEAPGPVNEWSRSWLGYGRYDGVALTANQLKPAPPEVRRALWRDVECGGALVLVGGGEVPDSWARRKVRRDGVTAYYAGFGVCLVPDRAAVPDWEPEQWRALIAAWDQSDRPWQRVPG